MRRRIEIGDRVRLRLKRGKYVYGVAAATDRHRIEWIVNLDDGRTGMELIGNLERVDDNGDPVE